MTTVVSVAQGGTGANSAALARTALGVPPSAAYDQANTARAQANTAYGQANNSYSSANLAYAQANTAYGQANSAYSQANSAYGAANTRLSASGGTVSGDLIITGNLTVSGNSTTLNTEVLTVEDAEVVLLSNVASTPALNAGVIVNRGTSTNTFLRWNESIDEWGWSDNGTTTYYFDDLRAGLATTNTTFGTINTSLGTINTSYQAAYAQANTAGTNALNAYGQANAARTQANSGVTIAGNAYAAANNRVLKSGDTMTGNLIISAAAEAASGTFAGGVSLLRVQGSTSAFSEPRIDLGEQSLSPTAYIASKNEGNGGGSLIFGNRDTASSSSSLTERMRITPTGSVGIGTTNPIRTFTVAGGMAFAEAGGASRGLHWGDSTTGNVPIIIGGDATAANSGLNFSTAPFGTAVGINRMRIDANGNVSVNTTSTLAKFQVHYGISNGSNGLGDYGILLTANTGQATMGVVYDGDGYANFNLGSTISGTTRFWHISKRLAAANHDLHYYFNNGSTFTLLYNFAANGNFGIGTASPSQKLDVTGSIRASSQLISTVATGTAPLSVSSTTAVTNLNADMVDGYHASTLVQTSNSSAQTTLWNPYGDYYTTVWGVGNDYNNFINSGSYHVDASAANRPENNYGYLRIWRHVGSNYLLQEFNSSGSPATTWRRLGQDNGSGTRVWTSWVKYWSDGNDGSGSGLDADLLDGLQPSALTVGYCNNTTQGFNSNWNTDFSTTPAGGTVLRGDTSTGSTTGGPGGTWWFQQNMRHTNASNVWGVQVAWGWEDNANILRTRNIQGGNYASWVTYINSSNYATYVTQLTSLGVGTAASGTTGEIRATGDITAFYSDDRLKNRLGNIDNALSKILTLNGFYYEPNQIAMDLGYEKKKQVGVSAQEVKEVLPEVVVAAPIDDKYMTVHYHKLVPLLIEAIKELNTKIEDMQKIIESKG